MKKEVLPTLEWMRRCLPRSRTVLGLRDIMDDAESVRADWEKKGVYDILDRLYDEIWIYGLQSFYDPIQEYAIPQAVSEKICFTGYIQRRISSMAAIRKVKKEIGVKKGEKLVVVTTGGGGDGYALMDNYLRMLESQPRPIPFRSFLITGPFMPRQNRREIFARARRLSASSVRFYSRMEEIQAAADLVVSMGGYNTICEILSQGTVSLIIPRENPRREQLIRAQVFHRERLVDYIPWDSVSVENLREKVFSLLDRPESYTKAISGFRLTGVHTMRKRLDACRNCQS
jgi:predicted glycosyltransferase